MSNRACWAIFAIVLFAFATVRAGDSTWMNAGAGFWHDSGNWHNGVPGDPDIATVSMIGGSPVIQLTNDASVLRFNGASGVFDLTFDVNGYKFEALITNNTAGLEGLLLAYTGTTTQNVTLVSSAPNGIFEVNRIRAGTVGRPLNLTFTGSNLTVNLNGLVGDNGFFSTGDGLFTISAGATMNALRPYLFAAGGVASHPTATWLITDPGTMVTQTSASGLYIGKSGAGMPTMIVSNGAAFYGLNITARVAQGGDSTSSYSPGANGKLIITGVGSYFTNTTLNVSEMAGNGTLTKSGYDGTGGGFVVVEQGAVLDISALTIGRGWGTFNTNTVLVTNTMAYGEVVVRGTGSVMKASGSQQIGRSSQGAVYVLDGGQYLVKAGANIELARPSYSTYTNLNSYGLLVVSNAGSYVEGDKLLVGGDLVGNGEYGYGDVVVADHARLKTLNATRGIELRPRSSLTVSDALVESRTLVMESNTTLRLELGSRAHNQAYIQLTGALNAASDVTLQLAFLDDFDTSGLSNGDEVRLITMGSYLGGFSGWVNGVTTVVHGDYTFLFNEYASEIYLSVSAIPEPGTLGLIGAGLGLAALLRRRVNAA
ncbi:MAG: PEP-CTERM sorting domain-containing protein [Kiritimatiellia bacterium]|nr:PEP-CTERM sorting domain-containing protein [Kiritimatiellia bacterium]